jgi:hypothetical protein
MMADTLMIVVYCKHCGREQLLSASPHTMDQFNHSRSCQMRSPFQRKQAHYQAVPGRPTVQWEDHQDYRYYEYGLFIST